MLDAKYNSTAYHAVCVPAVPAYLEDGVLTVPTYLEDSVRAVPVYLEDAVLAVPAYTVLLRLAMQFMHIMKMKSEQLFRILVL